MLSTERAPRQGRNGLGHRRPQPPGDCAASAVTADETLPQVRPSERAAAPRREERASRACESGENEPPPLLALSAGGPSAEPAAIPLLPRELVPPGQGWDTEARGGWGWRALPLPVLYLFCG